MSRPSACESITTASPRQWRRSTPHWRRKAIRRSDSPWGQRPSRRSSVGVRRSRYAAQSRDRGGWLIGPTWLYVAVAVIIFIFAVVVAIVQAASSDDAVTPSATVPTTSEQAAVAQSSQTVNSSASQSPSQAQPAVSSDPSAGVQLQQSQAASPADSAATPSDLAQSDQSQSDQSQSAEQPTTASDGQAQPNTAPDGDANPGESASNPLRGFIIPIAGACISEFEGHLPSSPRGYRNDGVHEGLDFYQWAVCTTVDYRTPVLAAKAGVIIRADLDYTDITPTDWQRFTNANWEGADILDELRGRQVWIDHGRGVVTRYAHLSAISGDIAVGAEVTQGQLIGFPGESGQQEVYAAPGTDVHLHFEIRIAHTYLGHDQAPQVARQLYLQAFGLASAVASSE